MGRTVGTLLILLAGLVLAPSAHAADFTVQRFRSDITVSAAASIDVEETIVVDFPEARHGIYRNIPFRYTVADGSTVAVPIEVTAVMQDGMEVPWTVARTGSDIVVRIGDPDRTIHGTHTYRVSYTAMVAVNFFSDHDELYWNVTGSDWAGAGIPDASASVRLPSAVPAGERTAACYTGAVGSSAANCSWAFTGDRTEFQATDYLTVVLGWPKGVVVKPADYESVRAGATPLPPFFLQAPWFGVILGLNLLLVLGVVGWLIVRWRRFGRDPVAPRTLVVQYDPPPNVSPAEAHAVVRETVSPNTDTTATIVDLAVHGWLRIVEKKSPGTFGLGTRSGYSFIRLRAHERGTALKTHERVVLDGMFGDTSTPVGGSVELTQLTTSFPTRLSEIGRAVLQQVTEGGYFVRNPRSTRNRYLILGLVVAGLGVPLTILVGLLGIPVAGLTVAIASRYFPKRTTAGVNALNHLRGFREYLEKAEKYRLHWQEKENVFERFLPYAMVFGVAERWSKAFEGMTRPQPDWYQGTPGTAFNSMVLWTALSGMNAVAVRGFTAASDHSGLGGGGFSGGGFGGGGGGSW